MWEHTGHPDAGGIVAVEPEPDGLAQPDHDSLVADRVTRRAGHITPGISRLVAGRDV